MKLLVEVKDDVSWSDRCVSCKNYDTEFNCCRLDSKISIDNPDKTTCSEWRYVF